MNHNQIEALLSSKEKCEELLNNYEQKFLQVSMIADKFENGEIKTEQQLKDTLDELTGLYMQLDLVTEVVDTYKTGEEGRLNFAKTKELTDKGEKVNQSSLDKIISHEVHYLRRVRNIFNANRNRADKGIGSCQSRLKNEKKGNYRESSDASSN